MRYPAGSHPTGARHRRRARPLPSDVTRATTPGPRDDLPAALARLFDPRVREEIVLRTTLPAREGATVPLPGDLPAPVREALAAAGVQRLYQHQAAALDLLRQGANLVVATGTASGKSLCYQLTLLEHAAREPDSRALLLFPTKALAQDQTRRLLAMRLPGMVPAVYDGDTPAGQRGLLRRRATVLVTNPDMLHVGILPAHDRWAGFLHGLRLVVLDEAHVYRGVFGSHVAQVLRRLRRLCAAYGSSPQFVVTSATIARPLRFAERLVGLPFAALDADAAPHPARTVVLWNPPLEDAAAGRRRSALAVAAGIVADCVLAGARVIAFAPSRKAAELVHDHVRRLLAERRGPAAAARVSPYRAGYTAEQRREIERRLFAHELDAVVATSALELGIDVGALDVAVVIGFPGTVTSLLQRWGRAGRRGHGTAVLVAGADALDQYFMREPQQLLGRPVEEAVVDLANPHILGPHLEAAAYERPLTAADAECFGAHALPLAERLAAGGRLRRRGEALVWSQPHLPAAAFGLRTASSVRFLVVEHPGGEVLGHVEAERVFRFAHPGAVYLHLGESYLVRDLDLGRRLVHVEPFRGAYTTQAKTEKTVTVTGQAEVRELAAGVLVRGGLEVSEQVVAFQRRDARDGRVLDTVPLDLPEQTFATEAVWLVVPPAVTDGLRAALGAEDPTAVLGALHAAEHALIALLPLFAMCDRWDIGGLSTPWHWQTDQATIFIYDAYPGGIGLTRRGFEAFADLARAARDLVAGCPCEGGCPSCVQSPKCGNLNEPLSKAGAVRLLSAVLATAAGSGSRPGGGLNEAV